LTRDNIINLLWKYDFYGDGRIVDTHIKNLRKKLNIELNLGSREKSFSLRCPMSLRHLSP